MSEQTLSLVVQLATLISTVLALISIWIGVRIYRRQMNAQVFLTYTQRYEAIMSAFPEGAIRARFSFDEVLPPSTDQLSLCVLRYLNLCSEEFYLTKTGYLDGKLWNIWADEMKRMMRAPLVRREWPALRSEFESYPAFLGYIEGVMAEESSRGATSQPK
jgi:hypothetical protein